MSTRKFDRLRKLANIGKAIGSKDLLLPICNAKLLRSWSRQGKFVSQCHQLSSRALWWSTLQLYDVNFDMYRFERDGSPEDEKSSPVKYPSTLLPTLISNMSRRGVETKKILQTTEDYCRAFGLGNEIAISCYLEYLLSPVPGEKKSFDNDIRLKLPSLEILTRDLLSRLKSPRKRIDVLRRCLINLEMSANCKDYERLEIISALYQAELGFFIRGTSKDATSLKPFLVDLELVDRRRDALAILSSYFQGEKKTERPPFSNFFSPFPESLEREGSGLHTRTAVGILGSESEDAKEAFDPLRPLDGMLSGSSNSAATSALAPLCLPFGVPRGFIHARSLIARFKQSKREQVAMPSFEDDVMPVLNRLKSSADIADLAEWCATQYSFENEDKLRCLEIALNSAIQASSEAERRTRRISEVAESLALERVKRISKAKDVLVDRLAITAILASAGITSEKSCALSSVVDDLMERLEEQVWLKDEFVPETFVEIFLTEASLVAADGCLCDQKALSIGKFQQLCIVVHRACKSVAERYSHVQIGETARRLARKWLFHGDQLTSNEITDLSNDPSNEIISVFQDASRSMPDIEEEDTLNFVMDLASIAKSDNAWSGDVGGQPTKQEGRTFSSEEEPYCLKFPGCSNETSEHSSRRVSLRIAFVMAYADGYHSDIKGIQTEKENLNGASNHSSQTTSSKPKARGGLLAKVGCVESKKQHGSVVEHSRELLRIVFAKSGFSEWDDAFQHTPNLSTTMPGQENSQTMITFAMRHRALRAASILCPQEALEEVIIEEGFLKTNTRSSLKKCCFGAYVAKEIEELGLPLPHSDLSQLSTINFPSYSRTLWRHHRESKVAKGRLLLLIVDMYLKEPISDFAFFLSIMSEIEKSRLPRTLLLALESVGRYVQRSSPDCIDSFYVNAGANILKSVRELSLTAEAEFTKLLVSPNPAQRHVQDAVATSKRLGYLMKAHCHFQDGQMYLERFLESQLQIAGSLPQSTAKEDILMMVHNLLQNYEDSRKSHRISEILSETDSESVGCRPLFDDPDRESPDVNDFMSISLNKVEASLDNIVRCHSRS
eukprot:scaffold443_cov125-Cylindrotheca_fusiformis.AAC.10